MQVLHWLSFSGSRLSLDNPSTSHPVTMDLHMSCQLVGTFYSSIVLSNWHLLFQCLLVLIAPICRLAVYDVFDNVLLLSFFCLQTSCSPWVFSWSNVHSCGCQVLHTTFSCSTSLKTSANWPQGLAFIAIEENTLQCCIEEAEFDLSEEGGVPYVGLAIQDLQIKYLAHLKILLS